MEIFYTPAQIQKYIMTAEEFISIWKGEKMNDPQFKDFYNEDFIQIANKDLTITNSEKRTWVIFRNIEVSGIINLIDPEAIYSPINISGCHFHGTFQIQQGQFENLMIGYNGGENYFECGINIIGGTFKNATQLYSLGSKTVKKPVKLSIHGGIFETKLRIWSSIFVDLEISKGIYEDGISVNGSFQNIFITGGIMKADFDIETIYCYGNFQIIGNTSSKFLSRDNNGEWVADELLNCNIHFENSGIHLKGTSFIRHNLIVSNLNALFIRLSDPAFYQTSSSSYINCLHFINFNQSVFLTAAKNTSMQLNSIVFEDCTILKDNIVRLDNLSLNRLEFKNLINTGTLILNSLQDTQKKISNKEYSDSEWIRDKVKRAVEELIIHTEPPLLRIETSNLGAAVFMACDFSKFTFNLISSKITDVFLAGTEMPMEIESPDRDKYYQQQLGYGQLKKVYQLRGDFLKSQEFYTKELRAYYKSLRLKKNKTFDKFNLYLNDLTSRHGLSWERALTCVLAFGLLSYTLLCLSLGYTIDLVDGSYHLFFDLTAYIFTYINPIHRNDFLKTLVDSKWTPLTEIIDAVSRLVFAYLIYQFIQAFRRYGRNR